MCRLLCCSILLLHLCQKLEEARNGRVARRAYYQVMEGRGG